MYFYLAIPFFITHSGVDIEETVQDDTIFLLSNR